MKSIAWQLILFLTWRFESERQSARKSKTKIGRVGSLASKSFSCRPHAGTLGKNGLNSKTSCDKQGDRE